MRPNAFPNTSSWVIFQSTHPRGVRPQRFSEYKFMGDISIHAPTWGATRPSRTAAARRSNFNPRTHVGCDSVENLARFHHTDFNPRTHVGCDFRRYCYALTIAISIHAPTWGATAAVRSKYGISIFQSTHPRGVRLLSHQMVGF